MKRVLVAMVGGVLVSGSAALAECKCGIAKFENGWCADCKVGFVAGVKIKSDALFDALQGHEVDEGKIKCPSCTKAHKAGGFCEACKTGFVDGKAYHSWVAYRLASGEFKRPGDIKCGTCQKAAAESGWCDSCNVGYVAHHKFTDKNSYEQALAARKVLAAAADSKCQKCAVAMVSDGKCDQCGVTYKNGEKTKTAMGG